MIAHIREQVRQHVCGLPDEELLQYAYGSEEAYDPEAMQMAREEATRRGLKEPALAYAEPVVLVRRPPVFSGSISDDRPCLRCGYSLKGLAGEETCPRCGLSAGWTLGGNALRFADAAWVRRLRIGLEMAFWFTALVIASLACSAALPRRWFDWAYWIGPLTRVGVATGVLLLTAPEPQAVIARGSWVRQWLRITYACQLAFTLLFQFGPNFVGPAATTRIWQLHSWVDPLQRNLMVPLQVFLLWRYLADIVGRTNSRRLAIWLGIFQWIDPTVILLTSIPIIVLQSVGWDLPPQILGCLAVAVLAAIVATGVTLWLVCRSVAAERKLAGAASKEGVAIGAATADGAAAANDQ